MRRRARKRAGSSGKGVGKPRYVGVSSRKREIKLRRRSPDQRHRLVSSENCGKKFSLSNATCGQKEKGNGADGSEL